MWKKQFLAGVASLVAAYVAGCNIEGASSLEGRAQVLMAEWQELAAEDKTVSARGEAAAELVERMAQLGAPGLAPFMALLEDAAAEPEHKVLALVALTPHFTLKKSYREPFLPRLIALSQKGNETTSRACSVHLLAFYDVPEARTRLKELFNDEEARVRVAAGITLMRLRDPDVLAALDTLYHREGVGANQRGDILLMMPPDLIGAHLALYREGALDMALAPHVRAHAVSVLGNSGSTPAIPVLKESAEKDPEPLVRKQAAASLAALQEHYEEKAPAS